MPETLSLQAKQQIAAAVAPALERIRRDRDGTPLHIQRLLTHIEQYLLDPDLDVTQAKRACGIGDNSVAIQFHSVVGRPPSSYIEDRRLETASRLLIDTDFKIWQIAQATGYSSISAFSRAFLRWSGERPSSFRKERKVIKKPGEVTAEGATTAGAVSLSRPRAGSADIDLQRLLALLCPECRQRVERERRQHADSVQRHHVASRAAEQQDLPSGVEIVEALSFWNTATESDEIDRYRAELIWSELENCSWSERRELVRKRLRLTTPSFFHFLREKSGQLGRRSLQESLNAAQLALDSLESFVGSLPGNEQADLYIQGWTCLAQAQTLASDSEAAEHSLQQAESYLDHPDRDPTIEAEMLCIKATLRRNQRRWTEAHQLFDRAFSLCPPGTRVELMAQLLIRRATLLSEEHDLEAAIADLQQARQLLEHSSADHLKLSTLHGLAVCLEAAGRYDQAMELLPQARQLCVPGDALSAVRLCWLEGRLQKASGRFEEAETAFLEAHQTFLEQGDAYCAAFACLDLAELYAQQDRGTELRSLSIRLAPLFETLQLHREALAALKIFRQALETEELSVAVVSEIRRRFARARRIGGSPDKIIHRGR